MTDRQYPEDYELLPPKERKQLAKFFGILASDEPCDRPVEEMLKPAELGEELGISLRQVQNLEDRGLPTSGRRSEKRHPWPLCLAWFWTYRKRYEDGRRRRISWLDPIEAWMEYRDQKALHRAYNALERGTVADLDPLARRQLDRAGYLQAYGKSPWQFEPRSFTY